MVSPLSAFNLTRARLSTLKNVWHFIIRPSLNLIFPDLDSQAAAASCKTDPQPAQKRMAFDSLLSLSDRILDNDSRAAASHPQPA